MKDLCYSIETIYPKDDSKLIDSYTEAVFGILKNKINYCDIEELILKLKDVDKDVKTADEERRLI